MLSGTGGYCSNIELVRGRGRGVIWKQRLFLFLCGCSFFNLGLMIVFHLDIIKGFVYPVPVLVSKFLDFVEIEVRGFDPVGGGELVGNRAIVTRAMKGVPAFNLRKGEHDVVEIGGDLRRRQQERVHQMGVRSLQTEGAIEYRGR